MSGHPRSLRFLRLAALATVVAACLIAFGSWLHLRAGGGGGELLPISVFVGLAAIVGSAVNQPFRTDDEGAEQAYPLLYFLWKCAVAVSFALLLYLVFMGGLLSGTLFPAFPRSADPYRSIGGFVLDVNPGTNADFAKLLVWSFVAGFSEKFVPNLITKLEGRSSAASGKEPEDPAEPPRK